MSENDSVKHTNLLNPGYLISMGILLIILGLIISTQTRRYIEAEKSRIPEERQLDELVALLKETQIKKSDLEKQLSNLKVQIKKLNNGTLTTTDPQFHKLYTIAGLTLVKGDGITIKLDDKSSSENPSFNNDGLVHSDDLLKLVNELKAAGAKAISINNQRIVTTSEIVTAGAAIMVNQTRLIPPYTVKAIGPVDTMIPALKMRGGIIEYLEVFGINVSIEHKKNLVISPYYGNIQE